MVAQYPKLMAKVKINSAPERLAVMVDPLDRILLVKPYKGSDASSASVAKCFRSRSPIWHCARDMSLLSDNP